MVCVGRVAVLARVGHFAVVWLCVMWFRLSNLTSLTLNNNLLSGAVVQSVMGLSSLSYVHGCCLYCGCCSCSYRCCCYHLVCRGRFDCS